MTPPDKGFWPALASVALSLSPRYRLFLAIGILFVGFFLAAGFIYRLTNAAPLAVAALAFSVAGLGVITLVGVVLALRAISPSSSE